MRVGTLLLFAGLALLLLGAGLQISRSVRTQAAEQSLPAPAFRSTVRHVAPSRPSGSGPVVTALPPRRIELPTIGVDSKVVDVGWEARIVNGEFQGNVWQTADYAAGHHTTSAPLGAPGNTVISGHNNVRGAVFKDLYLLDIGDPVILTDATGHAYRYEVVESFVVKEEGATESERRDNTQWIRPSPDERVTLVTCFPPWSNTHRAIVVAFPVDGPAGAGPTAPALGRDAATPK
jgi:sortase A